MNDPYHIKYRPTDFDQVLGQPAAVKSLLSVLDSKAVPHSFLFTGPSGTGKTTMARIIATDLGISTRNLLEVDAATNSGVDDMRTLKQMVETPAFGADFRRMVLVDECHSLSKNAWQSWLKIIEEPPEHLFIVFCTTESGKVPKTIKTRCHSFDLKPIPIKTLEKLVDKVADREEINLPAGGSRLIANKADGSARQALVYLSVSRSCKNKKQLLSVLDEVDEKQDDVIKLCRLLISNTNFLEASKVVANLETQNMESVRIVVLNYVSSVLLKTKSEDKAMHLLSILDEFSEPFRDYEKKAPLLLALGRLLL